MGIQMKLVAALCVLALAAAAPAPALDPQLLYNDNDYGLTNYKWGFRTISGLGHDQEGELKNEGREDEALVVKGTYSWTSPEGIRYTVTYVADENGYQPVIVQQEPQVGGFGGGYSPNVVATLLGAG